MRVLVGLIGVALVITMVGSLGVAAKDKPQTLTVAASEQKVMIVPGNKDWTNTGLTLRPRDRVTIKATGNVWFNAPYAESKVDPDGWPVATYRSGWPDNWNICDDPLPEENHAALIGNVGSEVFLVGSTATFWGMNGYLYLGINDCSFTGNYYNTGEFRVVILVEREAVTLTKKPVIIRPELKKKPIKK